MKTFKLTSMLCLFLLSLFTVSCSSDDTEPVNNNTPTPTPTPTPVGEVALFAIDTARVNTISVTGTTQATIINKMINLNSYIGNVSISPDGTKLAYTNYQSDFSGASSVYLREIRVANINGSDDHAVFTSADSGTSLGTIRFCSDNKIFYTKTVSMPDRITTIHTVNADGSGVETISGGYDVVDVTDNKRYYILIGNTGGGINNHVRIIDKQGDNGAGSPYHNESFNDQQRVYSTLFTNNNKNAIIAYTEAGEIRIRIIDMETKAATTKTLVTGLSNGWVSVHLSMGGDSNRGVVTVTGADYTKSKSYLFNLTTGEVAAPFENNDQNIFDVFIY